MMSEVDAQRSADSPSALRVSFVSASEQNVFFDELLEALRRALEADGVLTETALDAFPPLAEDLVYVFVPHEYVPLTLPEAHPSDAQLRRTVVLATEQPGTPWFEESAGFAARAGATLDINALGTLELQRRGIGAQLLPLGYVPEWDHWHGTDHPRPIDATFLGGYSGRRAETIARCGSVLQQHRASIHLVDTRPHTVSDRFFLAHERKFRHLSSCKVLVNIHRSDSPYLEWQRVLGAIANGCVVLTEHARAFDPLIPGEHFVSVGLASIPVALGALLDDEARLESIRKAAYAFLREERPLSQSITVLADAVREVGSAPVERARTVRAARPAPKPPTPPVPAWRQVLDARSADDRTRMALKHLVLAQRRLERKIAHLASPETADQITDQIIDTRAYADASPRVTVALTLYNYAHVVREALASVALSTGVETELVIVDDASTDASADEAERVLRTDFPWVAARLVKRARNEGLPAARNLAVGHARGEYIFVLDADNAVYPRALERLAQALDDDPGAAFAYGIIEKFDARGSFDLVSWAPWSPERLAYGNYIDAMAMIRRSALERAGGYATDDRLHGLEDLALWCAFAQLGLRGVSVPEILARYRVNRHSMINVTVIDTSEAWTLLVERYPFLTQAP